MKQSFACYNINHITGILQRPTGQAITDRSKFILKDIPNKWKKVTKYPRDTLDGTLLTLFFLNSNEKRTISKSPLIVEKAAELNHPVYF